MKSEENQIRYAILKLNTENFNSQIVVILRLVTSWNMVAGF